MSAEIRPVAVLSVRQPWAWLILHGGKDIENRSWSTKIRGRVLIHAAKSKSRQEWDAAMDFALTRAMVSPDVLAQCEFETVERGGIVGSVEIVDCVRNSSSRWFAGDWGFVLEDRRPLPFVACPGRLGFFPVPEAWLTLNQGDPAAVIPEGRL